MPSILYMVHDFGLPHVVTVTSHILFNFGSITDSNDDVVVVRLEHSHSFIDNFDNHSTASGPASCRHPVNAVSGPSSTMCLVVWWLSPQGQAGDAISRPIGREIWHIWPGNISDDLE